ncbi:MAG: hypothetical protein KatS3mg002_1490 [Candidatus Woesearchaeota archaeon]|nr:MAG: hypothetical protein KatS3mg002_1490 [Candidatus Woesearchaeota archaeon]
MDILKKEEWEKSYSRYENFIFYPKEEVVKFLNRFIRKRIDVDKFIDILMPNSRENALRALDFGCGIGAQTILMHEFGLEAYGIDISEIAINMARKLAKHKGYKQMENRFIVYDGGQIPFPDNFFDLCISEGVLDSMKFELAKNLIKEIDRVTKNIVFLSLISGDDHKHYREFAGDEVVEDIHEKGTIQSYYNFTKILELIKETNFEIEWCRLVQEIGVNHRYLQGRYYIVLRKLR